MANLPGSYHSIQVTLCIGLLVLTDLIHAALLCSRCDSRGDRYYGECEQSPPTPSPCPENNANFCSIVRETNDNGIQILFTRGCATFFQDEKCIIRNVTRGRQKNVCFRTCATDGCNAEGLKLRASSLNIQASFSFVIATTCFSFFH
ncbi:uncharacterized protein LOC118763348 [Octopus sinensis]|uniref:Uncharacterized protein LOC118763348 n=1 Tax=Octopus sinensis TaxID=2607531 RepID=A0A7E6ETK0_9MOLL|nr:uncharacterized protein LOC118763348 [Octopus sinensis]